MYGLIGAAIGAISQNFNTSESIAANKQEQQANRDYNLNLAKMQNQWNREQWEREANYNSPAAYRARLAAAGMNPDLAYGNVNGTNNLALGISLEFKHSTNICITSKNRVNVPTLSRF